MPCRLLGWLPSDEAVSPVPVLWRGSKQERHPRIRSARRGVPLLIEEDIVFIIGIDPTRDRTLRLPSITTNNSLASCWCVPIVDSANGCCAGRHRSNRVCGRSKARPVTARCWRNSWSRRARPSSMCRPRCRHGHGCWTRAARTRPTRTTRAQPRSSHCGTETCERSRSRITVRSCGCWRAAITSSSPLGPVRSVGCMPCSPR